jgi:Amt family ammonium transporter
MALIHQGLGRSRSAAHAMLGTLCVVAISAIAIVLCGAAFAGFDGGAFHSFHAGGVLWNWLGNEPLLISNYHVEGSAGSIASIVMCLHIFAAGLAAIIPLSAGTDRWRLAPICLVTAVFSAFTYPLIAHWVWGGGWLAQIAVAFNIAPFVDVGGAGVIQVTGGLMALSVVWILGPRRGKYTRDAISTAIPGHNIVLVLFGCFIALVGWIGLESATSVLFYKAGPAQIVGVIVNATLSASAGCLAAVAATQLRYRKPDASLSANGWIAGLVAGSAGCHFVSPLATIATGAVAGLILIFLVEFLEIRLLIDDPGGAISVHAGAGILGLIVTGMFVPLTAGSRGDQMIAQFVGISTLLGFMLPIMHGVNLLLNRILPFRVDRDGDWQGMDIRELGAGAYPEFVIHPDESMPH